MRVIIQRVKTAQVAVSDEVIAEIADGLLLLVGVAPEIWTMLVARLSTCVSSQMKLAR